MIIPWLSHNKPSYILSQYYPMLTQSWSHSIKNPWILVAVYYPVGYLLICNPTIIPILSHYVPLYPIDYLLVLNTMIVVYPLMIIPFGKMIISLVIYELPDIIPWLIDFIQNPWILITIYDPIHNLLILITIFVVYPDISIHIPSKIPEFPSSKGCSQEPLAPVAFEPVTVNGGPMSPRESHVVPWSLGKVGYMDIIWSIVDIQGGAPQL